MSPRQQPMPEPAPEAEEKAQIDQADNVIAELDQDEANAQIDIEKLKQVKSQEFELK